MKEVITYKHYFDCNKPVLKMAGIASKQLLTNFVMQ